LLVSSVHQVRHNNGYVNAPVAVKQRSNRAVVSPVKAQNSQDSNNLCYDCSDAHGGQEPRKGDIAASLSASGW